MSKLDKSRCFTVEWKIVNFSSFKYVKDGELNIKGPAFKTETIRCSTWWSTSIAELVNVPQAPRLEYEVMFMLCDITGKSKDQSQCEVFLLSTNDEIKIPYKRVNHLHRNGIFCYTIKKDEIFGNSTLLPQDTLTVYYRFCKKEIINNELCMFRSVLYQVDFLWKTKGFIFIEDCFQKTLHQQDTLQVILFLISDHERGTHEVRLEAKPNKQGSPTIEIAELKIKDDRGRCIIRKGPPCSTKVWDIGIYDISTIISSRQFVQKYVKSLQFELKSVVAGGAVPCLTTAEANLLLFREKLNSDATLKTRGKSFPVHQNILSARSPVFRKMFEPYHPSLDISDVDSETLERLLVYLYGDTLEDVQWQQAMALYRAASTYAVPSLKSRCADILKEGLAVKNACDILVLADQHADEDLMRCTVDFIRDHREIVSSEEWNKVEASNLQLAAKITRELCQQEKA